LRQLLSQLAAVAPLGQGKRGFANQLRRFLEGAALPVSWQHLRWMVFQSDSQRGQLYRPEFRAAVADQTARVVREVLETDQPDRLTAQTRSDMRFYLAEDILPKVDSMSMATSLEARVPYLDNDLLDLALAIPGHMKLRNGTRKYILKKAFAGRLPAEILARGKEGFSMPMKNWLNLEWNALMHELLCTENLRSDGFFEAKTVARLMAEHESKRHNHSHLLWALMVYQLWKQRFQAAVP